MMPKWSLRSREEAYLLNPAFCASLLVEFTKNFAKVDSSSPDVPVAFCALGVSLHPRTRGRLPKSTVTSLFDWLENNNEIIPEFQNRCLQLTPYLKEALLFGLVHQALELNTQGQIAIGPKRAHFTAGFEKGLSQDMNECISSTRMLGRWFSRAGSTSTILSHWGVRP